MANRAATVAGVGFKGSERSGTPVWLPTRPETFRSVFVLCERFFTADCRSSRRNQVFPLSNRWHRLLKMQEVRVGSSAVPQKLPGAFSVHQFFEEVC